LKTGEAKDCRGNPSIRLNSSFSLEKRGRYIYLEGMKKSSRLKTSLSLLLVSILAATIMPTSVNAETTDFEDNVVTVEVDLGSEGPDPELCEGFASMTIPGDTLPATLNRRVDGNSSPTMADLLAYFWGDYSAYDQTAELYDNEDLQNSLNILNNVGGPDYYVNWNAVKDPEDATIDTLVSIDYQPIISDGIPTQYRSEDLDKDGDIDISDAPDFITETRRSYSTDWFTISYDANDCVESEDMAMVLVTRAPVLRAANDGAEFIDAEVPWADNFYETNVDSKAEAYLKVRTDLIGGLISVPNTVAWDTVTNFSEYDPWDVDPVAFGDEGSAQMRAMMNIYGSSPTGIYQANYYYQLEVNDEEYFFDEFGFFGCYFFGPC
jgi:hypothetical protein